VGRGGEEKLVEKEELYGRSLFLPSLSLALQKGKGKGG